MVSSKVIIRLLIGILILGLFLRAYNLDTESLWIDEAFSTRIASSENIKDVIVGVSHTEAAPPGYYVLFHYWIEIFGNSMFVVRLLSVVWSIMAILILFLLVRMLLNTRIALLASLFMATSMLQIEYAQEARIYALFTFLSIASVYFFVKWYKDRSNFHLALYALLAVASFYVNYLTFFIILGCSLFVYSKERWQNHNWWLANVVVALLSLPLMPLILTQFVTLNTGLSTTLINKGVPVFLAHLGLFLFLLPALVLTIALSVLLSRTILRAHILKIDDYFFYLMLLVGIAYMYVSIKPFILAGIPFIRVPITNSYFLIRHSFFLVPLWYVYLGYKVDQYFARGRKYMAVAIVGMVLFFSFFALHQYYVQPTKAQWQEAIQFIEENSQSEKVLVLLDKGGQSNEFLFRYYAPDDWLLLRLTWADTWRDFQQVDEERLFGLLEKTDGFWLMLSRNQKTGYYYRDLLDEKYVRVQSKELYQIRVYEYQGKK